MTRTSLILATAATAALWASGTGTAAAQAASPDIPELETVTVVAPRITYETGYRPGRGAPRQIQVVKQTAVVDARDLDLGRIADMRTLETRVGEAARRACTELAQMHPLGQPETDVCVRRASEDAMAQVRLATRTAARD